MSYSSQHIRARVYYIPAGKAIKFPFNEDRVYLAIGLPRNASNKVRIFFGEDDPYPLDPAYWVNQPVNVRYEFFNGMASTFIITTSDGSSELQAVFSNLDENPSIIDNPLV